jgi:hypothetical protein
MLLKIPLLNQLAQMQLDGVTIGGQEGITHKHTLKYP